LENKEMHKLETDGTWYEMDAGRIHSAVNFGRINRNQLVVRKLLQTTTDETVQVRITPNTKNLTRYEFDNLISPILNKINKQNKMKDFEYTPAEVKFKLSSFKKYGSKWFYL
jgi:hypothetical protein